MKSKNGIYLKGFIRYTILTIISVCMLFPFLWMLLTSLKNPANVFAQFIPNPIRIENYIEVLKETVFVQQFINSLYIAILVTLGTVIFSAMAGYSFARIQYKGRNFVFFLLLSVMMVPQEATIIPLFLFMRDLGWINTHLPLIVIPIFGAGGAFGVFVMRQFFITVPKELEEAARIDGCTRWKIFTRIMIPLAKPAISTLVIFTFITNWDEFLTPLVFINTQELMTLPLSLSMFTDEAGTSWNHLMSASVLATFPLLIVFFIAQKQFIKGMTMTGLKD